MLNYQEMHQQNKKVDVELTLRGVKFVLTPAQVDALLNTPHFELEMALRQAKGRKL